MNNVDNLKIEDFLTFYPSFKSNDNFIQDISSLKEFVSTIPNSSFEERNIFELSDEQIETLERRSKMPDNKYLTIDEANAKLMAKYV